MFVDHQFGERDPHSLAVRILAQCLDPRIGGIAPADGRIACQYPRSVARRRVRAKPRDEIGDHAGRDPAPQRALPDQPPCVRHLAFRHCRRGLRKGQAFIDRRCACRACERPVTAFARKRLPRHVEQPAGIGGIAVHRRERRFDAFKFGLRRRLLVHRLVERIDRLERGSRGAIIAGIGKAVQRDIAKLRSEPHQMVIGLALGLAHRAGQPKIARGALQRERIGPGAKHRTGLHDFGLLQLAGAHQRPGLDIGGGGCGRPGQRPVPGLRGNQRRDRARGGGGGIPLSGLAKMQRLGQPELGPAITVTLGLKRGIARRSAGRAGHATIFLVARHRRFGQSSGCAQQQQAPQFFARADVTDAPVALDEHARLFAGFGLGHGGGRCQDQDRAGRCQRHNVPPKHKSPISNLITTRRTSLS